MYDWIYYLAFVIVFYTAWGIGANDCANSFATSVGAKVLTLRQAVLIAAVFEFGGALLMGSHVTDTVRKQIVDIDLFRNDPGSLMFGMLCSDLAAGIWLMVATFLKLPVSTTHSTVGAIMGFALAANGASGVNQTKVTQIILSWIASPLISGLITFAFFTFIKRQALVKDDPVKRLLRIFPIITSATFFINAFFIIYKGTPALGLKDTPLEVGLLGAAGVGLVAGMVGWKISPWLDRRVKQAEKGSRTDRPVPRTPSKIELEIEDSNRNQKAEELQGYVHSIKEDIKNENIYQLYRTADSYHPEAEQMCSYLQIITACLSAFAHGANDVANAIGPFATIVAIHSTGQIPEKSQVPIWILAIGGAGIVVGLWTWGYKIIDRIGKELTKISPSRGFTIELGAATTVVVASRIGIPVSTTHCQVGSVVGCGLTNGCNNIDWKLFRNIIISWVVTLPVAGLLSAGFFAFGYYSPSAG